MKPEPDIGWGFCFDDNALEKLYRRYFIIRNYKNMEPNLLIEYRCACGKLLFKGLMFISVVEIKCKRCGQTRTFRNNTQGIRSFMLVVDDGGRIMDACEGIAVIECSRQYVIGKPLFEILPLARDAQYEEIIPAFAKASTDAKVLADKFTGTSDPGTYQIKNNTLILRDHEVPLESHVIPVESENGSLYRVFNVIRET